MALPSLSLSELIHVLESRELSAVDVVTAYCETIDARNGELNAIVAFEPTRALHQAQLVDSRRVRGEVLGALAGVPFVVKDLEDAEGFVTTKGSLLHAGDSVSTVDSFLVSRFRALGAIVLGKSNTPEFGWTGETVNRLFGATKNPHDQRFSPGGSSGGSASAVAAAMVPFATGSDGGGSIRIPSALCGLSGFKPSTGVVPSPSPVAPSWFDLSVSGPMARSLDDIALLLDEVALFDEADLRSHKLYPGLFRQHEALKEAPRRLLASLTLGYAPVDDEVRRVFLSAVEKLEANGVEIHWREDIFDSDPVLAWMTMTSAMTKASLDALELKDQSELLDPGLREALSFVEDLSAAQLLAASSEPYRLAYRLAEVMKGFDGLLTPTVSTTTPLSGRPGTVNGVETSNWVRFTYPFNMTRSPAATVPVGVSNSGLPLGVQLVGHRDGDVTLMGHAAFCEALFRGKS
jgi:Asp-tRNA(Asn)/Glu-tRNA(Gln) amidotransferase A subunit family amidase